MTHNIKILQELHNKRAPVYKLANYEIDCDKLNFVKIKKKILNIYEIY